MSHKMANNDPVEITGFGLYDVSMNQVHYNSSINNQNELEVDYFINSFDPVRVFVSNRTNTTKDYEIVIEPHEELSYGGDEIYALLLANVPPSGVLYSKQLMLNYGQELTLYIYEKGTRGQDTLVFKASIFIYDYTSAPPHQFKKPKRGSIPRFYQEY